MSLAMVTFWGDVRVELFRCQDNLRCQDHRLDADCWEPTPGLRALQRPAQGGIDGVDDVARRRLRYEGADPKIKV